MEAGWELLLLYLLVLATAVNEKTIDPASEGVFFSLLFLLVFGQEHRSLSVHGPRIIYLLIICKSLRPVGRFRH